MARLSDIRLRRSAVSGSIPSTSNLNLGELALNTADGKVYMKKSVGGTDSIVEIGGANSGITSTFTAYEYTATANQTTFSGSDNYSNTLAYNTGTPPKVQVFMNGILLDEGSSADYTGTNGTSVVLTTGADAGDLVQIHAYKSDVSVSSNISLGDNKRLQFGDSQDLQIFHDGNNSRITDTGTGSLILRGANSVEIEDVSGENMLVANSNGAVELYHNNVKKFETTASGVQTTGTVNVNGAYTLPTSDGSSGQALVSNGSGTLSFATVITGALTSMSDTDGDTKIQVEESSDEDKIRFDTSGTERLYISDTSVNINNSVNYFNVGGGSGASGTSIDNVGNITTDGSFNIGGTIVLTSTRGINAADGTASAPTHTFHSDQDTGMYSASANTLQFTTNGTERMRIAANGDILGRSADVRIGSNVGAVEYGTSTANSVRFYSDDAERIRITSDGKVGIGTTSPGYKLEVVGNTMIGDASAVTSPGFAARQNIVSSFQHGTNGIGRAGSLYLLNTNTNRESGFLSFGAYYNNTNNLYYQTGGIGGGKETAAGSGWGGYLSFWTTSDGTAGAASGQFEHMRITADGNVGINNTSPGSQYFNNLVIGNNSAGDKGITIRANSANKGVLAFSDTDSADANRYTGYIAYQHTDNSMRFHTNGGTERMRLDSSGNFLIGKTASDFTAAGYEFKPSSFAAFTRSGGSPLIVNRLSSDGSIIEFYRGTTSVGNIGAKSDDLYIGTGDTGIRFNDGNDQIWPITGAGTSRDNAIDIGNSSVRFKDLYLSGKAHIGHAVIDDYAVNTSATSAAQVDTFAAATFRTARYTIQITNTTDSTYHVTELLLIHDGTTPSITEYGTIYTGSASEATFDADIVSGNVRLLATPASSDTMQFKVVRHSILV